jgi:threonine dehydratase
VCRELGVTVELVENVHEAFARVEQIVATEGDVRAPVRRDRRPPLGTASVGLELVDQMPSHSMRCIVAAGGGGLTGGVACAVKQMSPGTAVYVVEPVGADSLNRSMRAGSPQAIEAVRTIADSLGAPRCEPYSFALNQRSSTTSCWSTTIRFARRCGSCSGWRSWWSSPRAPPRWPH